MLIVCLPRDTVLTFGKISRQKKKKLLALLALTLRHLRDARSKKQGCFGAPKSKSQMGLKDELNNSYQALTPTHHRM